MARPAVVDELERDDAVCCRPLELLLVVLFCPEPESVDDDSLEREELAVCVVPLVCASGCDEEELVELLELLVVLLDVVVVLEELVLCGPVLDEVLVEVSPGAEEDDVEEVLVLAVCVLVVVLELLGVDVVLEAVDDDVSLGAALAVVVVDVLGALVLLELVEVAGALVAAPPVSAGADVVVVDVGALDAIAVGVVVGALEGAVVVVGADEMVIGEELTALSDVEKPRLVGATVDDVDVDDELVVEVLLLCDAVCVAVCTAA